MLRILFPAAIFIANFLFLETAWCQNKTQTKITIVSAGPMINSAFADFAPVVTADGKLMIFTSRRPFSEKEKQKNKESFEAVYSSSYNEKRKKWNEPKRLSDSINKPGRHNSAIAISNDGQTMLLYRDDEKGNGDIYESKLRGEKWSEPEKMPAPINSDSKESSASISPDGNMLYFVSDRKGGQGGRDIWICRRDANGKWGFAENAGSKVNSSKDEEGVYIHPDGKTLFFSSKGFHGSGGYDIFKAIYENGNWSDPVNLGAPVNTPDDDLYFVMTASGELGYYSSAKAGGAGEKDIYEVRFTSPEKIKEEQPQLLLLTGTVTEEDTSKPLEATLEIIDNDKNEVVTKISSNKSTGRYLVSLPSGKNYNVTVKADSYLFHSENINVPVTQGYGETIKDIRLKKLVAGKTVVLNNIFYDFDKATLRDESKAELEHLLQLMEDNKNMKIELSSHTDNKGSGDYNVRLSQERAQSVIDFLIARGIHKDRLVAKGYGETIPVSTNETEDGRQQNRRTEIKVLSIE